MLKENWVAGEASSTTNIASYTVQMKRQTAHAGSLTQTKGMVRQTYSCNRIENWPESVGTATDWAK